MPTSIFWILGVGAAAWWTLKLLLVHEAGRMGRPLPPLRLPDPAPSVSILIPARDEERDVAETLRAVLAQDYRDFEVLLVDDHSSDGTARIAGEIAAGDPRLRVLQPPPLPPGWVGKSWALWSAVPGSRGEILLFLDADIRLRPDALAAAVSALEADGLAAMGLWPEVVCASFWERVLQPFQFEFLLAAAAAAHHVLGDRAPAATPGAFLLVRREAYLRAGGHESVRDRIVEDVGLGTALRRKAGRVEGYRAEGRAEVRMYHTLGEIWRGWSKNFFPGLNYRIGPMLAILATHLFTSILPPLLLLAQLFPGGERWVPPEASLPLLLGVAAAVFSRWMSDRAIGQPGPWSLFHPVAAAFFFAVLANSFRQRSLGGGNVWRGRTYRFDPSPDRFGTG